LKERVQENDFGHFWFAREFLEVVPSGTTQGWVCHVGIFCAYLMGTMKFNPYFKNNYYAKV
jgi:hypothetical protein